MLWGLNVPTVVSSTIQIEQESVAVMKDVKVSVSDLLPYDTVLKKQKQVDLHGTKIHHLIPGQHDTGSSLKSPRNLFVINYQHLPEIYFCLDY